MAWTTPKTDWNEAYEPSPEDMNRIEGNTGYIHDTQVPDEETARIAGDDAEAATRAAADDAEAATRAAADTALDTRVDVLEGSGSIQGVGTGNTPAFVGVTPGAYGAIGTIVIAASNAWARSTQYLPGTTVAGSTLYRSTNSDSTGSPLNATSSTSVSVRSSAWASLGLGGTWRLLTRVVQASAGNSTFYTVGLLQRIS